MAKKTSLNKVIIGLVLLVVIGSTVSTYLIIMSRNFRLKNQANMGVEASSSQTILSSDLEWNTGTSDNAVVSGGNITIDNLQPSLDLKTKFDNDNGIVTADKYSSVRGNLIDNNIVTEWGGSLNPAESMYWQIDLGSTYELNKIRMYNAWAGGSPFGMQTFVSTNGTDWTPITTFSVAVEGIWQEYTTGAPWNARYFKVYNQIGGGWPNPVISSIGELELYSNSSTATHTSGATQITNTNLYQWQTFTPTYTTPANTTISFKFRTSTNSTDWSAWTGSQTVASGSPLDITSLVTSKTGDPGSETFYKYIQVESTLTSTDGVSTPTLSDYTIGHHTNVKPSQPTAQSVTIGS